jgi:hypothetical protein
MKAIDLLNDGEEIHTFRNPNGILIGCDIERETIIEYLNSNHDKIEIGGETCRNLNHSIVLKDKVGFLFIETNTEKLNLFDPI